MVLSILLLLRRASQPNVAELGRVRESSEFASITDDQPRTRVPGVLAARVDGALLYFNAERARDRLLELVAAQREGISVAIVFLGTVPTIDLAGADMLIELRHALAARGIEVRFAGPHSRVRDALVRAGLDPAVVHAFRTVADALPH